MSEAIVVGVDGSETAKAATRWAAEEARLRGARLELVSAWEIPSYTYSFAIVQIPEDLAKELQKEAEDHLGAALEEVRALTREVDVETRAVQGQAAHVLLRASEAADLLVVGSRGLGGFRELLLGSVSQQCAHHATCPVVIVRHVHEPA